VRHLQCNVSQVEVLSDYAGPLFERLPQCSLARSKALRRQSGTVFAAREAHAKLSGGIGLKQKTPVGIRNRNGMLEHRAQDGFERQLGMQK
jgi:hypothetical protein